MTSTMTETASQVGDVFVDSWGYDQTNIDFYVVVGISPSGKTVKVQRCRSNIVEGDYGPAADAVMPDVSRPFGDVLSRRVRHGAINTSDYSCALAWDGKPKYQTASGWGH